MGIDRTVTAEDHLQALATGRAAVLETLAQMPAEHAGPLGARRADVPAGPPGRAGRDRRRPGLLSGASGRLWRPRPPGRRGPCHARGDRTGRRERPRPVGGLAADHGRLPGRRTPIGPVKGLECSDGHDHQAATQAAAAAVPRTSEHMPRFPGPPCSTSWRPPAPRRWSRSWPLPGTGRRRSWQRGPNATPGRSPGSPSTITTMTQRSSCGASPPPSTRSSHSTRRCWRP
jgi:hypothetical protein